MESQANLSDLKEALKETLESRGVLNQLKARIRAEIFNAIDDQTVPKPKLCEENILINELIREYLEYNNYQHALSTFLVESGQPEERALDRDYLAHQLNVKENPLYSVPLLYSITSALQRPGASTIASTSSPVTTHENLRSASSAQVAPMPQNMSSPPSIVNNEPKPFSFTNSTNEP